MIYLDYNATTPLDPVVEEEMNRVQRDVFGNPQSIQHGYGFKASRVIELSRDIVAETLQVPASSVSWSHGATDALRKIIVAAALSAPPQRRTILMGATEHKAALDAGAHVERFLGGRAELIPVSSEGVVTPGAVLDSLDSDVSLVCVMLANNETGVMNPIEEIGALCRERGVMLLCDITQAVGKVALDEVLRVADFAVCSAHKYYGPKSVGILISDRLRRRDIGAALPGGPTAGFSSGTLNPALIYGTAIATKRAMEDFPSVGARAQALVDQLVLELEEQIGPISINGSSAPRLNNTLNARFPGIDAEAVLANVQDVAISTGSACNAAVDQPSHVLLAMGLDVVAARECLRFSVGSPTTPEEIRLAAHDVAHAVQRVRDMTAA